MRLVSRLAPPTAIAALAAIALAITAAPASAERNDACSNARLSYQKHMNQAGFFIGLAGTFAFFGQEALANAADRDANRAMDLANDSLADIGANC